MKKKEKKKPNKTSINVSSSTVCRFIIRVHTSSAPTHNTPYQELASPGPREHSLGWKFIAQRPLNIVLQRTTKGGFCIRGKFYSMARQYRCYIYPGEIKDVFIRLSCVAGSQITITLWTACAVCWKDSAWMYKSIATLHLRYTVKIFEDALFRPSGMFRCVFFFLNMDEMFFLLVRREGYRCETFLNSQRVISMGIVSGMVSYYFGKMRFYFHEKMFRIQ